MDKILSNAGLEVKKMAAIFQAPMTIALRSTLDPRDLNTMPRVHPKHPTVRLLLAAGVAASSLIAMFDQFMEPVDFSSGALVEQVKLLNRDPGTTYGKFF